MSYIKLSALFCASFVLSVSLARGADDQSDVDHRLIKLLLSTKHNGDNGSKWFSQRGDATSSDGAEKQSPDSKLDLKGYTVCAVPGQNGLGSSPSYVAKVLGIPLSSVKKVSTPQGLLDSPDLGQGVCIGHLKRIVEQEENQVIIHATSQGTATTLNYIASLSPAEQSKIKAIILEATLASGNSAIMHTVTGPLMGCQSIGKIPGSGYLIPYVAKANFPRYWPAGKQPIKSLDSISKNIPIILMHSKEDPQLSFDDARALYHGLRNHGNSSVYFVPFEGWRHIEICDKDQGKRELVKKILRTQLYLKGEGLTPAEEQQYQPDHKGKAFREAYDNLMSQEKKHEVVGYGSAAALVGAALYGVSSFLM